MNCDPTAEHRWLEQLVGEWTFHCECVMIPGQPPEKTDGTESVRSFGGLWVIADGEGDGYRSHFALGFDTKSKRFVGTFIASMMTHLWIYDGALDAANKVLTLGAEGPNFTAGTMTKFEDIHEILDHDHRRLSSRFIDPDGKWVQFMTANYRRKS